MSHLNWNMQEFRRVWKRKIVIINEKKTYGISNRICFSRFPLYDGFFFAIPLFKNHSCSSNVKFFISPQQRSLLRQLIFLFFFLKQIHELSKSFYLLTFFSWSITVKIRWFKLRWNWNRILPPQPITIGPAYDKLCRCIPFESGFTRTVKLLLASEYGDMCSA